MNTFLSAIFLLLSTITCVAAESPASHSEELPKTVGLKRKHPSINIFDAINSQGLCNKRTKQKSDRLKTVAALIAKPNSGFYLSEAPHLGLCVRIENDQAVSASFYSKSTAAMFLDPQSKAANYLDLAVIENIGQIKLASLAEVTFMSQITDYDGSTIELYKTRKIQGMKSNALFNVLNSIDSLILDATSIKTFTKEDAQTLKRLLPYAQGAILTLDAASESHFQIGNLHCCTGTSNLNIPYDPEEERETIKFKEEIASFFPSNVREADMAQFTSENVTKCYGVKRTIADSCEQDMKVSVLHTVGNNGLTILFKHVMPILQEAITGTGYLNLKNFAYFELISMKRISPTSNRILISHANKNWGEEYATIGQEIMPRVTMLDLSNMLIEEIKPEDIKEFTALDSIAFSEKISSATQKKIIENFKGTNIKLYLGATKASGEDNHDMETPPFSYFPKSFEDARECYQTTILETGEAQTELLYVNGVPYQAHN